MPRSLPPLNNLRAFHVIGKHLSLSRAAAELHLTSSALSHQLLALEDRLGKKLFRRHGRGLEFTDVGRHLHARVDESLKLLDDALRMASAEDDRRKLVVTTLQTFGTRALLPRLHRFPGHAANTEIRIAEFDPNFDQEGVDCAICYGNGQWPGLESHFLLEETLVLVCSPDAIGSDRPLQAYADIANHPLLQARQRPQDWKLWLQHVGQPFPAQAPVMVLDSRNLVIEAAEGGLGLAVVDPRMVARELKSGRLVQPWPTAAKGQGSYYIVYPPAAKASPRVMAFRDWLLEEFSGEAPT